MTSSQVQDGGKYENCYVVISQWKWSGYDEIEHSESDSDCDKKRFDWNLNFLFKMKNVGFGHNSAANFREGIVQRYKILNRGIAVRCENFQIEAD